MEPASFASIIRAHVAIGDWLQIPAALVDLSGMVLAATPQALSLFDAGDLVRVWDQRLQVVSPSSEPAYRQALAEVSRAARLGLAQCLRHCVVFGGDGRGRLIRLSLVQGGQRDEADEPLLLVTLRLLSGGPMPAGCDAPLVDQFGLTPDEAIVARSLVCGQSVRQIAEDRWNSIKVVRRQINSLYHKIGERAPARPAGEIVRAHAG